MDYKLLINKNNIINKSIINNIKLMTVENYLGNNILIEKKTYFMYKRLKEYLSSTGIDIFIDSSYRSLEEQEKLFNEIKSLYGEEYANSYVSHSGYSEHHTGLCIDIVLKIEDRFISSNEDLLNYENAFTKIHSCLKDFGFILRYPKEKETITGYFYEPWHIRYVGKRTATIIYNENLTLEEYHSKYNINGVLLVNKPSGMTSRDVDNFIARKFDTKKVGHTGTLDPLASGVLIVLINNATKIGKDIVSCDKEYIATVKVGVKTDTLDVTGKVLENNKDFNIDGIESILSNFEKTYLQTVPIYSAVKVNGKKLYEYARDEESVCLPKKEVTIKKIELLDRAVDTFSFKCLVSKGTYIRSLIRDIGESMGKLFTMQDLVRVREGVFTLDRCNTLEEIDEDKYNIISIEETLPYEVIEIDIKTLKKVKNGSVIDNVYNIENKVIFKYDNKVIAIYENNFNGTLKCYKNFCYGRVI